VRNSSVYPYIILTNIIKAPSYDEAQ
jgi:hypothetical protein